MPPFSRQHRSSPTRKDASAVDISVSDTPNGRFPKSAHLLRHSDFVRVYQQGRHHFSGNMTFFYLQGEGEQQGGVRVGFTVPKALGGAVERNRMRRRTREAVRHHLPVLQQMDAAVDVVINPKKTLLTAEFAEISQEVERAFGVIRRACANGGAQPRRMQQDQRSSSESKRPSSSAKRRAEARR